MTIGEFFRDIFCAIKGFALACVITLGIITVLKESGLVRAKNIDGPKSEVQLANPLKGATMDEPKADTPAPKDEEKPRVSAVIEGTGEFDGKHTLNRELTEREKDLARILLKIAKMAGSKHYPITEPKPDGLMVATVIGVGEKVDGYWVRNKKLAGWEKELVHHLLELAKESGGEYEPDEKK